MRDELFLEDEQFSFQSELDSENYETGSSGAEYARWIQRALNTVMGLRLTVDGIIGPQTRSAVRSFQQRSGLVPDGVVGPKTQTALLAAGAPAPPGASTGIKPGKCGNFAAGAACASLKPKEVLDNFRQDSADIKPEHDLKINQIACCIRDSQSTSSPIRRVEIVGHASTEGDVPYNQRLGAMRAERVRQRLHDALKRVSPGLENRVALPTDTRGEVDPTGRGPEADRRVEIRLPLRTTPPPRPPTPVPPPLKPRVETVKIVIKSFIDRITRLGAPTCNDIKFIPTGGIPIPTTAAMRLQAAAAAIGSSVREDPPTDAMINDYRLFSQAIFTVTSVDGKLTNVTPSNLVTDVGPECDPTGTVCLEPPPMEIVSSLAVRKGPTSFTFGWMVRGKPHERAEILMDGVCDRDSVFIWHRIEGLVDVSSGRTVVRAQKFEGSEFPSHRLFVNGVRRQDIPQGEFRQLWISSPADRTLVR